jgi:hypothetical protein
MPELEEAQERIDRLRPIYEINKPKPPKPRAKRDTVYFVKCTEFVKIGITSGSVKTRIDDFRVGNPHELTLLATIQTDSPKLDSELHRRFSRYRHRGEWFLWSPAIEKYIRENAIVHATHELYPSKSYHRDTAAQPLAAAA